KPDGNRGVVQFELGENGRNFKRVIEVGVAVDALLRAMLLHGVHIGLVQQILVGVRVVGLNELDKLILSHHGSSRSLAGTSLAPEKKMKKSARQLPDAL